jgi:hypothetical protein
LILILSIPIIEIAHDMSEALKNTVSTKTVWDLRGSVFFSSPLGPYGNQKD